MTLKHPFFISSRLLPAVRVGEDTVSIEFGKQSPDGRIHYRVHIDFVDGTEFVDESLRSGVGGGSLRDGMSSYLSFLGAAAESYRNGSGENSDLFPPHVVEWAHQHNGEISVVQFEIEETEDCLTN